MAKILIVDADADFAEVVSVFLKVKGHEVHLAHSRAEGMTAIEHRSPDLLILDVMMDQPDDGLVMVQTLRRQQFKKPIIMLSAVSRITGYTFAKDEDFVPVDSFIDKPVDMEKLASEVEQLLKNKEGNASADQ